jgi:hypothetical protein
MARVELPVLVTNPATGLPVSGASVAISQRSNAAAVTWWTAESGGTSSTAAVVTDANGRATAWTARGAYNLTISGAGLTTYVEPWDAMTAPDLSGETLWLGDGTILDRQIATGLDAAKLTAGTLPASAYPASSIATTALIDATVPVAKLAAGTGTRLLAALVPGGYTLSVSSTTTLLASTAVTHNGRAGIAVLIHTWRATGSSGGPTFRLYLDGTIVSTQNYAVTSSLERGMVTLIYNYASLSGSHNWLVDATQGAGSQVNGDGTGLLLLFETY